MRIGDVRYCENVLAVGASVDESSLVECDTMSGALYVLVCIFDLRQEEESHVRKRGVSMGTDR